MILASAASIIACPRKDEPASRCRARPCFDFLFGNRFLNESQGFSQIPLHRGQRNAKPRRDLFQLHVFHISQNERNPVPGAHPVQDLLDAQHGLTASKSAGDEVERVGRTGFCSIIRRRRANRLTSSLTTRTATEYTKLRMADAFSRVCSMRKTRRKTSWVKSSGSWRGPNVRKSRRYTMGANRNQISRWAQTWPASAARVKMPSSACAPKRSPRASSVTCPESWSPREAASSLAMGTLGFARDTP